MPFDVNAARQSGYSDAEITSFLAQQKSFDLEGARKVGYADNEIIEHLSESKQSHPYANTELRQGKAGFLSSPTSNVSPVSDSGKMAGMGDQAIASLPTDSKERATYFAKQRFPDDPNAISKYGIQDGRLFYEGGDGKFYFEEPEFSVMKPGQWGKAVASSVGPALPIAGSIAGGIAGGPAGGIPMAGAGAAAGDEARQLMAMALAGKKEFSPWQTAGEAALGAGGQAGGALAVKGFNRHAVRDIARIQTPEAQRAIAELQAKAQQEGITLTPAELTNLKSLRAQQNILGDLPRSADIMQDDLYTPRNTEQVPGAVNRFLGQVSPVHSMEVGAKNLQEGGQAAISFEQKALQTQAKPFYDATRNVAVPTTDHQALMKDPFLRQQMRIVMRDPKYQSDIGDLFPKSGKTTTGAKLDEYGMPRAVESAEPPVDAKVGFLDVVKKRIDGMIEAEKSGAKPNRNNVRIYTAARERLLKVADQAAPDYAKARGIYEDGMPAVTALTKGEVGLAAKAKPTNIQGIPSTIFTSGPDAIKYNRSAYVKAGQEQQWNDGLRAYLANAFDKASKEYVSGNANPGARFRATVFGTGNQRGSMRVAMSPDQWENFNRLMEVLDATGRVTQGGSRTHFSKEGTDLMRREAGSLIGKGLRAMNPRNLVDWTGMANTLDEIKFGKHSEKLAEIITSSDAMKQLKQLRALTPNSVKAMTIASQLLTQYGISGASGQVDVPVGGFSPNNASPQLLPQEPGR